MFPGRAEVSAQDLAFHLGMAGVQKPSHSNYRDAIDIVYCKAGEKEQQTEGE